SSPARRLAASIRTWTAASSTPRASRFPASMPPARWRASAEAAITGTTRSRERSSAAASSRAATQGGRQLDSRRKRMQLTNQDIADLVAFRRELHRNPKISNEESETAKRVVAFLRDTGPDQLLTDPGTHGVAAVYDSGKPGLTVLFRSDLDALPIEELSDAAHRATVPGKSHMCGHDGHTAILAAIGRQFGRRRPERGRVVLMFQPAEETGNGASDVIADPRYARIAPDYAFSLHNLPGTSFGHVRLKPGVVNCASRGMRIVLKGKTAH